MDTGEFKNLLSASEDFPQPEMLQIARGCDKEDRHIRVTLL